MNVGKIMTATVISCRASDSLNRAAGIMWDHDCGCVPVVDDDERVIGMLTDRDICMAGYFHDAPMSQLRVLDAMSKQIIACKRADSIEAAEKLMQVNQIRRLPVLDGDDKLVGILSLNDIARFARTPLGRKNLYSDDLGNTLAAVCTPRTKDETAVA